MFNDLYKVYEDGIEKEIGDGYDLNIYTMCNSKCKIRGIGSNSYIYLKASDEDWHAPYYYKIFVERAC